MVVFKLCVKQIFAPWVCYFYLFYSAAPLLYFLTQSPPPAQHFCLGFMYFINLAMTMSQCWESAVLLYYPCINLQSFYLLLSILVYSERPLSGIVIFHILETCRVNIHVLPDSGWLKKKRGGQKKAQPFYSTLPSLDGSNVTWRGSRMSQGAVLWSKILVCVTAGRQHLASCGFIFF